MAVHDASNGVVISQEPGEIYTSKDRYKIKNLPAEKRGIAHENILTGQYVDKIYQKFLKSNEGKEFTNYLRKYGNGTANPGKLEEIIITNNGEGLVAATMPDYLKANIIINADYIDTYCKQFSAISGLSYDDVLTNVITHELNHYFGQTKSDRKQPELLVEFDNDSSLIEFYMSMANKYPEESSRYVKKAELFTERYSGKYREAMDKYIANNMPKELFDKYPNNSYNKSSKSHSIEKLCESYSDAA